MNCQTSRQTLDASRPGQQDWDEPELRDAADHVTDCESCQTVMEQQDRFDRQIAEAMQEVAVPSDLKARLLETIDSSDKVPTLAAPRSVSRRRTWGLVSSAALLLVACCGWWVYSQRTIALTMDGRLHPAQLAAGFH